MRHVHTSRSGLTLVELMIAAGLAAILMTAVFQLLDVTLDLWSRGETRRSLVEQGAATGELLARDLRAVHGGQQGDFLVDWHPFDADGDQRADRVWPRVRMVRQASAGDIARIREAERQFNKTSADDEQPEPDPEDGLTPEPPDPSGLMEVVWAVLPAGKDPDVKGEGVLWRGERLLDPTGTTTYFSPGFFDANGTPELALVSEVTGGVLWFGVQLAAQTSVVHDGWKLGSELASTTACWDAWNRGRPDLDVFEWNETHVGMPAAAGAPLLPRRVRIELEFERPRDRQRRTRILDTVERDAMFLTVENGDRIPKREGLFLLVDAEWLEVINVRGDTVNVKRGARATQPVAHDAGAMVHFGEPIVIEVPIPLYVDDWNL
ncbi:MAG: hypothetical protein GY711_14275 [bacterium]|nr:hypothetical protein [bacterium]